MPISSFIPVLFLPLIAINMLGGVISGIWLAVIGEWGLIGYGLLALLFAGMLLGLAMMPGMIFAGPALLMLEKGNRLGGYVFGFLSTVYTVGVLSGWCILVLLFFLARLNDDSFIPGLLWSYGIATGPIAWLAHKDSQSGNEYSGETTFFLQIAYLVAICGIVFFDFTLQTVLQVFGGVMVIALLLQFVVVFFTERQSRVRL